MLGLNDFCTNIFVKYKMGSVVKEEKNGLPIGSLHDDLRVFRERSYIRFIYPTEISI